MWGVCLGWLTGEAVELRVCAFAAEFSGLTPALPLGAKGLTADGEWVCLWALPLTWCLLDAAVGVPARYQQAYQLVIDTEQLECAYVYK